MRWQALAAMTACAGVACAVQPAAASTVSYSRVSDVGVTATPSLFDDATCPDNSTCYLVGGAGASAGLVTLTRDGGHSWHSVVVADAGAPFTAIACVTAERCVVLTGGGEAVTTGDGFATLAAQPAPSNLSSVACPDSTRCIAAGAGAQQQGVVAVSADGGATWRPESAPGEVTTVRCIDATRCWAAGGGAWATSDLGATWRALPPPTCTTPGACTGAAAWSVLTDIEFTSASDGYAVGGDQCGGPTVTQCPGALYQTTDGGATWSLWPGSRLLPTGWQLQCRGSSCTYVTQAFHTSTVLEGGGDSWSTLMTVSGRLNALACTPDGALCVIGGAAPAGASTFAQLYSTVVPGPAGGNRPNGTSTTATVPVSGALQSTIATTAATPSMVASSGANALVDALVVLLLVLFITFPSQLFNRTWEENHEAISAWWARHVPRPQLWRGAGATRRRLAFTAVLVAAAVLGTLLDPRAGLDGRSALAAFGIVFGLLAAIVVSGLAGQAFRRSRGVSTRWHVHALPGALPIGIACVVVSRLVAFEPGYLYGVIGGVAFVSVLDPRGRGQEAAVGALATLAVAVIAWLAWSAVSTGTRAPTTATVLLEDVLATVFVSGLIGLVVGLVPLRFLPGERIARWNRAVWAVLFALSCFAMLEIMLQPQSSTAHVDGAPFWTTVGLFAGFGAASVGFWGWFRRRPRAASGGRAPAQT